MRSVEENKKLIERYPFLLPRNRWTDKVPDDYDYTWTEIDAFPSGWYKVFGEEMLEEIREDCIKNDYLDKLRILQIKEKYGTLRFYTGAIPVESKIFKIISKYEEMSAHYCMVCGAPAETSDIGWWLVTLCDECKKRFYH